MIYAQLHLTLPPWVHAAVDVDRAYPDDDAQVALAIELSRRNVEHASGGPFGAAVFTDAGRLVGVGVNRVVAHNCSSAHAEVMALSTSQQRLQQFRLNAASPGMRRAPSAPPCAMCTGALIGAGTDTVLTGARADDVQTLAGFDEGPLPADWRGELERRGIAVKVDLRRDEACAVLRSYGESGVVY
jgi:tRNA(Arg) A34 adenosine deaminase TadA